MELEKQSIGMLQTETKNGMQFTLAQDLKKVEEELKFKGIETFLPLVKTIRKWSDRKNCKRSDVQRICFCEHQFNKRKS